MNRAQGLSGRGSSRSSGMSRARDLPVGAPCPCRGHARLKTSIARSLHAMTGTTLQLARSLSRNSGPGGPGNRKN